MKKQFIIILIVVLVLVVGFLGYRYFNKLDNDLGNFYSYPDFFEFKYPGLWQIRESDDRGYFTLLTPEIVKCEENGGFECSIGAISLDIDGNLFALTGAIDDESVGDFEEWLGKKKVAFLVNDIKRTKIGSYNTYDVSENGMIGYRVVYILELPRVARFTIDAYDDMTFFEEIITSFKFIN